MIQRLVVFLCIACALTACDFLQSTPFSRYLESLRDDGREDGSSQSGPEIKILQGLLEMPPGGGTDQGEVIIANPKDIVFTIENLGDTALHLTGTPQVILDGDDAPMFDVILQPSALIPAGESTSFTIRFTPSSTGGKTVSISISSDDPDEGVYSFSITGTGISVLESLSYFEITDPANWAVLQQHLIEQAALGVSGPPSLGPGSITVPSGGYKWVGGVLAPNGRIYCIPRTANNVLIIDPETDSGDLTTISGLAGTEKWSAGVLAPNGKIYGIPFDSPSVMILDPQTNTADTTTITGLSGSDKWQGGVLAPNGKIYCIPRTSSSILIIDPETNTTDTTTMSGLSGTNKWFGGVLAPNGKIYCIPYNAVNVLIIDPSTNTVDADSITGLAGSAKWYGGVLAPNGKIYCMPCNAANVLIIDPASDMADTTTISGLTGFAKWQGGVLSPDGRIFGIPRESQSVLILDPAANTADTTTLSGLSGTQKWAGGILAPNGKIYGIPAAEDHVLIIDPRSNGMYDADLILSSYFNRL